VSGSRWSGWRDGACARLKNGMAAASFADEAGGSGAASAGSFAGRAEGVRALLAPCPTIGG